MAWTLAGVALASKEDHSVFSMEIPQTARNYREQAVYEALLIADSVF